MIKAVEPLIMAELPEESPAELAPVAPVAVPQVETIVPSMPEPAPEPPVAVVEPLPAIVEPEPVNELELVKRYKRNMFGGADSVIIYTESGEHEISSDEFDSLGGMQAVRAGTMTVNVEELGGMLV